MQERQNHLKFNSLQAQRRIGMGCSPGSALVTEVVAGAGPDGLLRDVEHSPNDLRSVVAQLGNPESEHVQRAIGAVLLAARSAGKTPGILAQVWSQAQRYAQMGFRMLAVGSDLGLLRAGSDELVQAFGRHAT